MAGVTKERGIAWGRTRGVDYMIYHSEAPIWPVKCKHNFDFRAVDRKCRMNQIKAKARAYFDKIRKDERLWR